MKLNTYSEVCPHCGTNLIHSEIPESSRSHYIAFNELDDGRPLYYYRTIGLSSMEYDCVIGYKCPDCGVTDAVEGREYMWETE